MHICTASVSKIAFRLLLSLLTVSKYQNTKRLRMHQGRYGIEMCVTNFVLQVASHASYLLITLR